MFTTSADLLNLALAIGFSAIALFLCLALYQLIFVLRDLSETTRAVKHAAQQIDEIIIQPTKILSFIFEKVRDIAGFVENYVGDPKKISGGRRK